MSYSELLVQVRLAVGPNSGEGLGFFRHPWANIFWTELLPRTPHMQNYDQGCSPQAGLQPRRLATSRITTKEAPISRIMTREAPHKQNYDHGGSPQAEYWMRKAET